MKRVGVHCIRCVWAPDDVSPGAFLRDPLPACCRACEFGSFYLGTTAPALTVVAQVEHAYRLLGVRS